MERPEIWHTGLSYTAQINQMEIDDLIIENELKCYEFTFNPVFFNFNLVFTQQYDTFINVSDYKSI